MILLGGIPSEAPLRFVADELTRRAVPFLMLNQRRLLGASMRLSVDGDRLRATLDGAKVRWDLENVRSAYVRLMDPRLLPEAAELPPDAALFERLMATHETLVAWIEATRALVINRPSAQMSNGSKPFQAQLIKQVGFDVPDTLITNDPERVWEFWTQKKRIVYKSISSVRSIVAELSPTKATALNRVRVCPVQFQELIQGEDVRVHVVGEALFATRITSSAVDYRYAGGSDTPTLEAMTLDDDIAERCLTLSARLGLPFVGIDLKVTRDGRVFCLEANPSPAYTYYEVATGQGISTALAEYLLVGEQTARK